MSVQLDNIGGHIGLAGHKEFKHHSDPHDKGIKLSQLDYPHPTEVYRTINWGNMTPKIEKENCTINSISQDAWIKARTRGNQYGLRASENIHGVEWYDVSNIRKEEKLESQIQAETYNINTSSYLAGHAMLPPNLGRNLPGSSRVLQRAPGDIFITSSAKHNDQNVIEPGGVASGLEGERLKMV